MHFPKVKQKRMQPTENLQIKVLGFNEIGLPHWMRKLYLPAWIWQGKIESHYAGLVSSMTRSGKRPVSGTDTRFIDQNLVPASQALRSSELNAIRPFEGSTVEFDPKNNHIPFEIAQLTREFAKSKAHRNQGRHINHIRGTNYG